MALQESEGDTSVGEYIDSCNDALALLGHSNRQMKGLPVLSLHSSQVYLC
jgi:hypothetical protein